MTVRFLHCCMCLRSLYVFFLCLCFCGEVASLQPLQTKPCGGRVQMVEELKGNSGNRFALAHDVSGAAVGPLADVNTMPASVPLNLIWGWNLPAVSRCGVLQAPLLPWEQFLTAWDTDSLKRASWEPGESSSKVQICGFCNHGVLFFLVGLLVAILDKGRVPYFVRYPPLS
jgi:hypothetical protein